MDNKNELTFLDHLEILRRKILLILAFFFIAFIISLFFTERIVFFFQEPLSQLKIHLNYFKPYEKFVVYMKVACLLSAVLTTPFALFQTASFIYPALNESERMPFVIAILIIPLVFIGGAFFAYTLIIPSALRFFITFGSGDQVLPLWGIKDYFDLIINFLVILGFLFQTPLLLLVLMRIGVISVKTLSRFRKHIIVIIAIIAGIFSPPDILSQLLVGIPLYLLFELTLIIGRFIEKKTIKNDLNKLFK